MKNLSIMIKPASSACNLRCKYCFYADVASLRQVPSFGRMSLDMLGKILGNIRRDLAPGDSVSFGFQGGEPTLAGLRYYREFVRIVGEWDSRIRVSYSLQTNGIALDDAWCTFLEENDFLVGISLDILPDCHDLARVDSDGKGTYQKVAEALELLKKHGVEHNVLCTLTNQVARHPAKVWKQLERLDIQYVQFIPCLDELENSGESPYALTPKRFAAFYTQLFRLWEEAYRAGRYRSIKLFDDLVNLLAFGIPTACGVDGICRPQLVVEADGGCYPCDFYCLDEYKTGNLGEQSLREIYESPVNLQFAQRPHESPRLCGSCPYFTICGGGCKRMQRSVCCTRSDSACGYRAFLDAALSSLTAIAREQRIRRGG